LPLTRRGPYGAGAACRTVAADPSGIGGGDDGAGGRGAGDSGPARAGRAGEADRPRAGRGQEDREALAAPGGLARAAPAATPAARAVSRLHRAARPGGPAQGLPSLWLSLFSFWWCSAVLAGSTCRPSSRAWRLSRRARSGASA